MKPHENMFIDDLLGEIWKPLSEYGNRYHISSFGRIKCVYLFDAKGQPRKIYIKKLSIRAKSGYVFTGLTLNKKRKSESVHRIVGRHFIKNKGNKPFINHKNGVKWDNRVENLEWCTAKENINHAMINGLMKPAKGEDSGQAVLTNKQVLDIFTSSDPIPKLCKKYNVHDTTIRYIKDGTRWSSVTGKKYEKKKYPGQCKLITINGVTKSYSGWASQWGAKGNLIFSRLKSGWSEIDAVTTPPSKTGGNKKLKLWSK